MVILLLLFFNPLPSRDGVFIMYLPTTNNGRTLWFSEHNSSIRENRFSLRTGSCGNASERERESKNSNLNNIITPSGEVACWPRAYYYKVLLSAPPPTPRKKNTRVVCVCTLYTMTESCAVQSPNRKFKTKKCKKNFYYTTLRASRPSYCSRILNSGKL